MSLTVNWVFTLINPESLFSSRFLKTHCFQLRANDPGAPLGPGRPWLPRAPLSPLFPWEPAEPEGPWGPLGPGGPASPLLPLGPEGPCLPRAPSSPFIPRGPSGPSAPWLPGDPATPAGPAGPGLPWMPGIPCAQKHPPWPRETYDEVCWRVILKNIKWKHTLLSCWTNLFCFKCLLIFYETISNVWVEKIAGSGILGKYPDNHWVCHFLHQIAFRISRLLNLLIFKSLIWPIK